MRMAWAKNPRYPRRPDPRAELLTTSCPGKVSLISSSGYVFSETSKVFIFAGPIERVDFAQGLPDSLRSGYTSSHKEVTDRNYQKHQPKPRDFDRRKEGITSRLGLPAFQS